MKTKNLFPLTLLLFIFCLASYGQAQDRHPLNFPNADIETLLMEYESLSGKNLIIEPLVLGGGGGSTIKLVTNPNNPPTKEEALELIEAALLLNNVSIVPYNEKTVKVLVKPPRAEGIPLITDINKIPNTDQPVSYYMQLTYIAADAAQNIIQSNIQGADPNVTLITPIPDSQALIVTSKANLLHKIIEIKELIDVPPAKMTTKFIQLTRADAETVTEILQQLFQESSSGSRPRTPSNVNRNANRPPVPVPGGATAAGSPNSIGEETKFIPESRTNRILVSTRPTNFEYIENLIKEIDSESNQAKPTVIPLKYLVATDIINVVADILEEDEGTGGTGINRPGTTQQPRNTTNNRSNQNSNTGSGAGGGTSLSATEKPEIPEALTIGKTKLIADNRTNSIMVMGPPESIQRAKDLLYQLDKRPRQIFLNTVLGTLTLDDTLRFGVDVYSEFLGATATAPGGFVPASNTGARGSTAAWPEFDSFSNIENVVTNAASGLNIYGVIGGTVEAYINALASTSRFQVLSRPSILTRNNKEAFISQGTREPVPSSTLTNTTNTDNFQTNIEYEDAVLELRILPFINADNEIVLNISQSNNQLSGTVSIGGVNNVPVFNDQTIETEVTIPDRSTVMIGGLIRESPTRNESGVPLLKDIPLLGYLFKTISKEQTKEETIILIQPTVLNHEDELLEKSDIERERSQIEENISSTKYPPQVRAALPPEQGEEIILKATAVDTLQQEDSMPQEIQSSEQEILQGASSQAVPQQLLQLQNGELQPYQAN